MKRLALAVLMIETFGLMIPACTTTYTQADLQAQEIEEDEAARAEEARDRKLGQEGGTGQEITDEEKAWADHESDL